MRIRRPSCNCDVDNCARHSPPHNPRATNFDIQFSPGLEQEYGPMHKRQRTSSSSSLEYINFLFGARLRFFRVLGFFCDSLFRRFCTLCGNCFRFCRQLLGCQRILDERVSENGRDAPFAPSNRSIPRSRLRQWLYFCWIKLCTWVGVLWGGVCVLQWMWCAGRWCKLEGKDSVVVCPKTCSLKHQENRTGANGVDAASRRPLDNDGVKPSVHCIGRHIAVVCLLLNIPSGFADYVSVVDRKRGIKFNLVGYSCRRHSCRRHSAIARSLIDCTPAKGRPTATA